MHPGVEIDDLLASTGWPLRVAEKLQVTAVPAAAELAVMREIDPQGFWTK